MNVNTLKDIMSGKATKRQFMQYFVVLLVFLFSMFFIAQSLYPVPYTPLNNHISNQGGLARNPDGHIFFIFGVGITGLLLIPYWLYLYRVITPGLKIFKIPATIIGIIGAIGFSVVGLVPEDIELIHDTAATVAFGGLGFAAFLYLFVFLYRIFTKQGWPRGYQISIIYGIVITLITTGVIMVNMGKSIFGDSLDPRLYTWPPWQWTSFLAILFWLLSIFLIIPERNGKDF